MTIRVALIRETLNLLQHQSRLASEKDAAIYRIATRYLLANMAIEYDIFLRLQTLEGAAGVPVDRWWKKGKLGFKAAADAFAGTKLDPIWLDPKYSGMYGTLERVSKAHIRSTEIPFEPFDFINNALMGIPMDASSSGVSGTGQIQRPPYQAGKFLSDKIKNGEETPQTVAKGVLGQFLKRKILNETRNKMEGLPEDDAGKIKEIPDRHESPYEGIGDFISALLFGRGPQTPLSKKLNNLMRHTWASASKKYGEVMIKWLDKVQSGKSFTLQEFCDEVGILPQVFTKYFRPDAWNAFFKALRSNKALLNEISDAAFQAGVEWDPNDPIPLYSEDPASIAKGKARPRTATYR